MKGDRAKAAAALPAATVVLARDQKGGLQVLLLRRSAESRFMGGSYVFPGGLVEPADNNPELWLPHVDLPPAAITRRIGGDRTGDAALAAAVAGIRETFEEAGVLLGGRPAFVTGGLQTICDRRLAGRLPPDWLEQLVQKEHWTLQFSRLFRWSRWITPPQMRFRYDTRFFLARMPEDQVCTSDMQETVHALWIRPEEALEKNLSGQVPLSPPTLITLHEMLPYDRLGNLAAAAAKRRWGTPLTPRLISDGKEQMIIEPWDPAYRQTKIRIDPAVLHAAIAPVGESFSRLWFSGGVWKPVRR